MVASILNEIIDKKKIVKIKDNICYTNLDLKDELIISRAAWGRIFKFNLQKFIEDRKDFEENKLKYHIDIIEKYRKFSKNDIYLEIGCGPAYIGEYLMKRYDLWFIGIDFNLEILKTLRAYLVKNKFKKFILIHADINDMPLKSNTIDYIYGGGVIEHFADTNKILAQSYRVLKRNGISFNTVPAFTLSWLPLRFYNNIPDLFLLRNIFEYFHIKIMKNKILEKNYGYELSFTKKKLFTMHKKVGFRKTVVSQMAFYPSVKRLKNKLLRDLYYHFAKSSITTQIYYVAAQK